MYRKVVKWILWTLMVISVIVLIVCAFVLGFDKHVDLSTNILLYWTYAMLVLSILAVLVVGLTVAAKNNPKALVKMGIGLAGVVAICLIAYLVSPGNPAVGLVSETPPTHGTLKFTDTLLNITYFVGALSIIAIIAGEIVSSVRTKKE